MNTSNIITARIDPKGYTITKPVTKEDYGILLKIEGADLPQAYEVDFSNSAKNGSSVPVIGNNNSFEIPADLIKTGTDIYAFIYYIDAIYGKTVYKIRIPNAVRPDRSNGTPTPSQQSALDQAIFELNESRTEWKNMRAEAVTLEPGESATASYSDGVLTLGIPGSSGGGGVDLQPATTSRLGGIIVGSDLSVTSGGVLSVVKANRAEQDNTHPITAAAVYTEVGNINALLQTI